MKKTLSLLLIMVAIFGLYLGYKSLSNGGPAAVIETQASPQAEESQAEPVPEPEEPTITIAPEKIIQGDPALITLSGLGTSTVKSLTFNGKSVGVFNFKSKLSGLVGIDLRMTPGTYPVVLTLSDGRSVKKNLVVSERVIVKAPLGIPEKLGGNTTASQNELVNTLVQEGAIINAIPSVNEQLWSTAFRLPINEPVVITDVYGYSRETVGTTISHKGTDFRAAINTPILAMNDGKVAFVRYLRNYGNTVVVDHGLGIQTIYMHQSEAKVKEGDMVTKGQLIGLSGDTGYVTGPHLHLSIKIRGVSIDPMKFMELVGR